MFVSPIHQTIWVFISTLIRLSEFWQVSTPVSVTVNLPKCFRGLRKFEHLSHQTCILRKTASPECDESKTYKSCHQEQSEHNCVPGCVIEMFATPTLPLSVEVLPCNGSFSGLRQTRVLALSNRPEVSPVSRELEGVGPG